MYILNKISYKFNNVFSFNEHKVNSIEKCSKIGYNYSIKFYKESETNEKDYL